MNVIHITNIALCFVFEVFRPIFFGFVGQEAAFTFKYRYKSDLPSSQIVVENDKSALYAYFKLFKYYIESKLEERIIILN